MCAPHTHTRTGTAGLVHVFSARHRRRPPSPSAARPARPRALPHLQADLQRQHLASGQHGTRPWAAPSLPHTHRCVCTPGHRQALTHVEKRHVLSRPCAHRHTGGRPGAQRTPFPGPCCHTVETPRPPRAPPALPHPAQPVAWMKRQKYGWGGRGGQRGREGAEDEIIILPGLFISVIISGVFTPPPRPLPADPA